jgi:hypothetical protein
MADIKISEATYKEELESSDMIPLAVTGSSKAYHLTGGALFGCLPLATTTDEGIVELATKAETEAATDTARAVTPASLAGAIGAAHLGEAILYAGRSTLTALTRAEITTMFTAEFGRAPVTGDLITIEDKSDRTHMLIWSSTYGGWFGIQLDTWLTDTGRFKSFT